MRIEGVPGILGGKWTRLRDEPLFQFSESGGRNRIPDDPPPPKDLPEGTSNVKFPDLYSNWKWDVPKSLPTYGHAYSKHGSHIPDAKLKARAINDKVQIGRWDNQKDAASFDDLEVVTEDIQKLLQITFSEHESSYWGIYNLAKISERENIRILYNFADDDWQEEDHKDCPLLIELNQFNEPEKMLKVLCENLSYIVPSYMEEIEPRKFTKKYVFVDGQPKLAHEYIFKKRE